jgi:hypothetical protein
MDGGLQTQTEQPEASGPEIRVYCVLGAGGKILAVKLNRTSATAVQRENPGSTIEMHRADKRFPTG